MRNLLRSSHCAVILDCKCWIVKALSPFSPGTIRQRQIALGSNKRWDWATEDIAKTTNDLPEFHLCFMCRRHVSPLTHLANGYLPCRKKGSAFSPPQLENGATRTTERPRRRKTAERTGEIYHSSLFPWWHTLSLLTPSPKKAQKKNYMSIFVPSGCLDRSRNITFSFPLKPIPQPYLLFAIERTWKGVARETWHSRRERYDD